MKLKEYLQNEEIKCPNDLHKQDWDKLFSNIGEEIHAKIKEGFKTFKIHSTQVSSTLTPEELGLIEYKRISSTRFEYFEVECAKPFSDADKRKFIGAIPIWKYGIKIPFKLFRIVYRCDIQKKQKEQRLNEITIDGHRYKLIPLD